MFQVEIVHQKKLTQYRVTSRRDLTENTAKRITQSSLPAYSTPLDEMGLPVLCGFNSDAGKHFGYETTWYVLRS